MSIRVVVLAGGLSAERDVSLRSGRRVADALKNVSADIEVIERDLDLSLLDEFGATAPDCVIPLLHGAAGEDGALRDVLESLGIPFIGATAEACRLSFDKPVAKALLAREGINTPDFVALPHSSFRELGATGVFDAVLGRIGLPLMVKPTKAGSALGASRVDAAGDFPSAMVGAFAYSDIAMMERFVIGTEIAVCVYETADGPVALPAVEIVPPNGIYDYNARYTAGTTEFFVPARLAADVLEAAAAVALEAHSVLGLRDWSRTDMIVDAEGTVWFLEVTVAPGMTETSLFPQALAAAGMSLGDLAHALVQAAISR